MTVLEHIDELRKLRGWSVNNLAMEAMLTQSTLNNLYARGAEPKLQTLRAICGAFGISLSEFFGGMEEEPSEQNVSEEVHRAVDALSPEQQRALLLVLRGAK